ncbi:MAG: iron-sulfur cluster assembly scaffold protein [Planctomycetes bacterium]|nr:iron-sulfur cluster assembly scaffold protein [Planctomycetota bacterium]
MDHFRNPRNVGEVPGAEAVGEVTNPVCGDFMRLSLRVRDGVILEARFKTFGCPAAIASSSMLTEMLAGRSLEEARRITNDDVARALGGLPPQKVHCSVLAEDTLAAALSKLAC